jgi:hypothetical protein
MKPALLDGGPPVIAIPDVFGHVETAPGLVQDRRCGV